MQNERIMEIQAEINGLQQLLNQSDYKAIKHSEGALSDKEFEPDRVKRQGFRDRINELQAELEALQEETANAG